MKLHKGSLALLLVMILFSWSAVVAQEYQFNWDTIVYGFETAEQLQAEEEIIQYDGSITIANHQEQAPEGCIFLLVELQIEKTAPGGEGFAWENLIAIDQDGVQYTRMENDAFLDYYGYTRLPATTLRIGKHDGVIAFVVPKEINVEQISLVYVTPEEELVMMVDEKQDIE